MKKLIALLLSTLFVLSVFSGCSPVASSGETTAPANVQHTLSVGFGRADVTPTERVPISGSFESRQSEGVNESLYATCVAITDKTGNTFMLIVTDFLMVYIPAAQARMDIAKETGIPATQIWIAATHNHAGPALDDQESGYIEEYSKVIRQEIVKAANAALEDRKPAKMHITDTRIEQMNFVRHYLMGDGSYAGNNFGTFEGNTIVGHASEPDNQMQLIKFTREGGKDIILMNWQGHPTGHSGANRFRILSCVTVATHKIEAELDCHFAYVLGASGNVNSASKIQEENIYADYVERYEALAQYAISINPNFKEVDVGNVQVLSQNCSCTTKSGGGVTMNVPLGAFAIGDVAFVSAPYEMFDTNGMFIKENSPFKMTFVSTCTNGYNSYIPSKSAFDEYDSYEESQGYFSSGTGELLADTFVSMLKTLYETK